MFDGENKFELPIPGDLQASYRQQFESLGDDLLSSLLEESQQKETPKGGRVFVTWSWAIKNQDDAILAQGENT